MWVWVLLVSLLPMGTRAEGWSFDDVDSEWGQFALGFAGSLAAHEAGHYVVARSRGYEVSHDGLSIVYPNARFTPADQFRVASAGFQTQWVLNELVLHDRGEPRRKPGSFGAGMLCAQIGTTLAYLTVLKDHPQGDIAGLSAATRLSNDRLALLFAVPGLLDAWRLFGDDVPSWVPQLSLAAKGAGMTWIWTY
jgi:hypothetical protein